MSIRRGFIVALGTLLLISSVSTAQFVRRGGRGVRTRYGRWYTAPAWGYGGYGWGYGGGTAYGNAAQGQAYMIAAQGQAEKARAQASLEYEKARTEYLKNKREWYGLLDERKRAKAAQEAEKKAAQAARVAEWKARPKQEKELPPRLDSEQMNASTGEIMWPEELLSDEYEEDRELIDELVKVAAHGGANEDTAKGIYDAARRMRTAMGKHAKRLGFKEYSALRKFLNSLSAEGQYALGA